MMKRDIFLLDRAYELRKSCFELQTILNDMTAAKVFAELPFLAPSTLFHSDSGASAYFALKIVPVAAQKTRYEDILTSELDKQQSRHLDSILNLIDLLMFDGDEPLVKRAAINQFVSVAIVKFADKLHNLKLVDSIGKLNVIKDLSHLTNMSDDSEPREYNLLKFADAVGLLREAISAQVKTQFTGDIKALPDRLEQMHSCITENIIRISDIGKGGAV